MCEAWVSVMSHSRIPSQSHSQSSSQSMSVVIVEQTKPVRNHTHTKQRRTRLDFNVQLHAKVLRDLWKRLPASACHSISPSGSSTLPESAAF